MSIAEFLEGLPSYDKNNFSRYPTESCHRICTQRPSVYIQTKDYPSEQIIVSEKTNILLRFLHLHWDKKDDLKRRQEEEDSPRSSKKPRFDTTLTP